ncbi:LD-carboxypeptidase LdcB, LAS superfamily [Lachnospiraceae bacterium NE2001]|nr:LD-carboxypeptidase LdcB, LAS superfamily [Lachnospiraceae bacterium NE2001]
MRKHRLIRTVALFVMVYSLTSCGLGQNDSNTTDVDNSVTNTVSEHSDEATPDNASDTADAVDTTEETTEEYVTQPAPVTVEGRPEEAGSLVPDHTYTLGDVHQVDGRQGVAYGDDCYYISGSTTLTKYDSEWNLVSEAEDPFAGFEDEVNHIGDIDVYDGKIYAGVEYFMDGESKNIQIAVYDAESFQLENTYDFDAESGQTEVSGIAVDPDSNSIWLTSWTGEESGRYIYRYDLENGAYKGKVHLQCPPQWLQGIAYYDGCLYMTADDGTADLGEPDHVYKTRVEENSTAATVVLERTLDDVTLQGEIEGISFDKKNGQMLISYNRGSQIVLGMVKGFYEGYTEEIHEVFTYNIEGHKRQYTFEEIDECVDGSGWNLILVNTDNPVPDDYTVSLTDLSNGKQVDTRIYPALQKMFDDARDSGIDLFVREGYRTREDQQSIMDSRIQQYQDSGYSLEEAEALAKQYVAIPGTSEHELGISVDINANSNVSSDEVVYSWLNENAYKYGFIKRYPEDKIDITGINNEPWHYRFVGQKAAAEMRDLNYCLEEYLDYLAE